METVDATTGENALQDNSLNIAEIQTALQTIHQSQKTTNSLTLFIVTIILFFSTGIISTSWQEIIVLIGVLLLHELGHFVAMKLLRYHDVKMFFIPFLGAAVAGKAQQETAVKSCIVSIMGPFPGIVIGVVLYILFALTNNYYALKTAQVMLLLNAFNMLPIMPLDGGRFIDVLFVNNKVFRLLFALLGAACFLGFAIVSQSWMLGIVGVFGIIGAVTNYRIHGIAQNIGRGSVDATAMDELIEREDVLGRICALLRKKSPALFTPKISYQGIYNNCSMIIDTLKFKPAGVVAKMLLFLMYPLIVLISLVIATVSIAGNFKEIAVVDGQNAKTVTMVERYAFGKVQSMMMIDEDGYYHGSGKGFGKNITHVNEHYQFNHGYRVGDWVTTDSSGDTTEIRRFDRGKLQSIITIKNGTVDTVAANRQPFYKKLFSVIREQAQPLRSNYRFFESETRKKLRKL